MSLSEKDKQKLKEKLAKRLAAAKAKPKTEPKPKPEPNFPVFRGWPTYDEWNPHIVRHLNVVDDNHITGMPGSAKSLVKPVAEFQAAYKDALATILALPGADQYRKEDLPPGCPENWLPLAYRLQPIMGESQGTDHWQLDVQLKNLAASKMGGIPDFRDLYAFTVSDTKLAEATGKPKRPQQSVHEAIQRVWPRCANCHKHMKFAGQVRMSPWLNSIYLSVNWAAVSLYGGHYQTSGLGTDHELRTDTKSDVEIWYYIFFCDCGVHYAPHCNAHLMLRTRYNWEGPFGEEKCLFDDQEYMDGICTQMDETGHDIAGPISLRLVNDMEYRFDLAARDRLNDDFAEALHDLPVCDYDHSSPFFFGEPHSQQDERRWCCVNTFTGFHRQSPIVWWHDEDHDMDYQIYGCLRCMDHDAVYCKLDASCT